MTPNRKAAIFLIAVATVLLIVGAILAGTQAAHADTCRFDNAVHDLAGKLETDRGLSNSEPGPTTCGVKPAAWIVLGAGGLLAVGGITLWLATATPSGSSTRTPVVDEPTKQFRRISH